MSMRRALTQTALAACLAASCERSTPNESAPPAPGAPSRPPAAASLPASASGKVVARYGPQSLTAEELVVELSRLPERSRRTMNEEGRKRFVDNLVLNDLLFAEGERQGFADDPEITRQVDDLRKRLVVQRVVRNLQNIAPVTDEEVRRYYEQSPDKFSTTTIKARHILVKDEAKAKELHAQVKANPSKFAELAQASSTDTASARKGGDLGFFGRGRMVPEFENAAFALKTQGELSEVVKTPYGYHIIQLEEIREGTQKPFEQVKEQIRATLRNQALQDRTKDYYDELKRKSGVVIDEVVIAEVVAAMPEVKASPAASLPVGHPPIGGEPGARTDPAPPGGGG